MVSFELDAQTVLRVSSAASLAHGALSLVAPAKSQELTMAKEVAFSTAQSRVIGLTSIGIGGGGLAISRNNDSANTKDLLKVHGATWLACAALTLYHTREGQHPRDAGYALTASNAVLGGLCLWKGLEN